MQTFLPYASFKDSAAVLDDRRLGKQRVECLQILQTLCGETAAWQNHPAVRMWRGHEGSLASYGMSVCLEWRGRGFRDTCLEKIHSLGHQSPTESWALPPWFGKPSFHASHKSNLKRKDPGYYGLWWPWVPEDLEYVWPAGILPGKSIQEEMNETRAEINALIARVLPGVEDYLEVHFTKEAES